MDYSPSRLIAEGEVDKDILYEIGVLIVTCANTDFDLGRQMLRLLSQGADESNELADPLVIGMDFRVKLAILRLLARSLEEDCSRIQRMCDRLQEIYQRRNEVAHYVINGRRGKAALFYSLKINPRTGEREKPKSYTATQIRSFATEMEYWAIALDAILDSYELPESTWPPTPELEALIESARAALDRSDQPKPQRQPRQRSSR